VCGACSVRRLGGECDGGDELGLDDGDPEAVMQSGLATLTLRTSAPASLAADYANAASIVRTLADQCRTLKVCRSHDPPSLHDCTYACADHVLLPGSSEHGAAGGRERSRPQVSAAGAGTVVYVSLLSEQRMPLASPDDAPCVCCAVEVNMVQSQLQDSVKQLQLTSASLHHERSVVAEQVRPAHACVPVCVCACMAAAASLDRAVAARRSVRYAS
jgi:hypothetical protein